jgi:hypothetical protein
MAYCTARKKESDMNLTDGQWQIVLGVIAIIVAIIFGLKQSAKRSQNQKQRTDGNSVGIQSGRDTKIK